jgi:hypothetical protein
VVARVEAVVVVQAEAVVVVQAAVARAAARAGVEDGGAEVAEIRAARAEDKTAGQP